MCNECLKSSNLKNQRKTLNHIRFKRILKHVAFQTTRHKDMQVLQLCSPRVRRHSRICSSKVRLKGNIPRTSLADTRVSPRVSLVKEASSRRASSRTCACLSLSLFLSYSLSVSRSMRVSVLNVLLNLAISRIKPPQRDLCNSYFSDGTLIFLLITITDFTSLYHEEIPASKKMLRTFCLFVYITYSLNFKKMTHTFFNYM